MAATFDVFDFSMTTINSEINYSIVFANDSNALGILIMLLYRTNRLFDFNKSVYFVQGRGRSQNINDQLLGVSIGTYIALAYDLEKNGRIASNLEAMEREITMKELSNGM